MALNKYILPTLYALKTALRRLERVVYLCGRDLNRKYKN